MVNVDLCVKFVEKFKELSEITKEMSNHDYQYIINSFEMMLAKENLKSLFKEESV